MPATDRELMILGHRNLMEFSREATRWAGDRGELMERAGVLCYAGGTEFPVTFNGAMRIDPSVDAQRLFDTAVEWFGERKRGFTLTVPRTEPDLVALTKREALMAVGSSPEMVIEAAPEARPLPDGIELRWVSDEAGMREFARVAGLSFATLGMPAEVWGEVMRDADRFCAPHIHSALLFEGDAAVACAQIVLANGGAAVESVSALPAVRKRGLGDAVTRAVTRRAFERGASAVTLEATDMGAPIYEAMGYRTLFTYEHHLRLPATDG